MVLVKKKYVIWCICLNCTDLNKTCKKYSYPFPLIDKLMYNSEAYKLLSFMDAYSDYNQILMNEKERGKTTFMMKHTNYRYNIMNVGLKKYM